MEVQSDMVNLTDLCEPVVVNNICQRYKDNKIYVNRTKNMSKKDKN